jgi:type III secretion system OrgA/MxiK family protein
MNPALLRVMYAPMDYIHQDYFSAPGTLLTPCMQQAVNHILIQRFSLLTKLDFSLQTSDFSQRLVQDWNLIPTVAWLLGCKLARGNMVIGGHIARLPVSARRFVELPIECPSVGLNVPVTKSHLEMHGARYLYILMRHLPLALGQRLPLMFGNGEQSPHSGLVLNRTLLTFAFDYATNTSN